MKQTAAAKKKNVAAEAAVNKKNVVGAAAIRRVAQHDGAPLSLLARMVMFARTARFGSIWASTKRDFPPWPRLIVPSSVENSWKL